MIQELKTISERLEKLERENRRLKRAAMASLLIAASIIFMGQAQRRRTLEAESFILKDANGRPRGELAMDFGSRPTLTLRDANGFPLVSLAGGDEPSLTLYRVGSQEQVNLTAAKKLFGLALYDNKTVR